MAAGDFSKAMQRTGNSALDDVTNLFKNIQVQRQKVESQKRIADLFSGFNTSAQQAKNNATTHPLTPMQNPVQNIQPSTNVASQLTGVNLNPATKPNITAPLKDENAQGSYVGAQFNPYQQNKQLGQGYVQSMMSLISNPDVLPEDKQQAAQMLGLIREQNTAQLPTTIERDPRKEYVQQSYDDSGKPTENVIQKGKEKLTKFDEHINDKGHRIVQYQDESGNMTEKDEGIDFKSIQEENKNKNENRRLNQNDARMAKGESQNQKINNQLKAERLRGQLGEMKLTQPDKSGTYEVMNPNGTSDFLTKDQFDKRQETIQNQINTLESDTKDTNKGKKSETKNTQSKFVEGKIYTDASGSKAKYVNGQWEEIK